MRKPANQPPVEDLLKNSQWVRHLALSLLRDRSLVDDVVQEVWTKAVERPPDKPQALPLWLKKVVRSVAFRANRVMTLRHRAETRHTVPRMETSPDEIAEHLEIQRLLTGFVLELDDPYKTVVYLHYFGGKRLAEIAAELGVPSSTVRTRLSRALEQLRGRLIARHGDRQWRSSLLPLALGPPGVRALRHGVGRGLESALGAETGRGASGTTRPPPGPLRPGAAWWALIPAAALLVWFATGRGRDDRARPVAPPSFASEARPIGGTVRAAARGKLANSERSAAPSAALVPAIEPGAPPAPGAATPPHGTVLVLDATTGDAVADAEVLFVQITQNDAIPGGRADARGLASVPLELLRRDALAVVAPGYVEYREASTLREIESGPHVVEIQPFFSASVRVFRPDGAAAEGVPVAIETPGAESFDPQTVFTDGSGLASYVYRHPSTTIRIDLESYATVSTRALTPTTRVDLRAGRRIRGVVLDPDGNAVSGCRVEIETGSATVPLRTETAPDGSFRAGQLAEERVAITFHHADWPSYRELGNPPPTDTWTFRLPRGDHLIGYVETPDGVSLEGGFAFVLTPAARPDSGAAGVVSKLKTVPVPEKGRATYRLRTLLRSGLDERGRFVLGPVTEMEPEQYLWIYHPRLVNHFEKLTPGAFEQGRAIRLRTGTTVSGRLAGPTGEPVAGALLHLGEIWSNDIEGIVARTRTRDDGSFELVGVPPEVDEVLAGCGTDAERSVVRSTLFVAAFPPDELLALGDLSIADSPIWHGFTVEPGARELRFLAAARANSVVLNVRLRDGEGTPIRAWTPVLVLDAEGRAHSGRLGTRGAEERFYCDHPVSAETFAGAHVIVMAAGFRWGQVKLDDAAPTVNLELVLEASAGDATASLRSQDGNPARARELLVGVPFGADEPRALVSLGRTDETGAVAINGLAPGAYRFYASRDARDDVGTGKAAARHQEAAAWPRESDRWIDLGATWIEDGGVTNHVIPRNR